ncbi:hypothetical protein G6F22_021884 [Rhizopus arrhizus]|nr:hypothetical protein G6F22_021884 [Rhizopus arrhizus]
MAITCQRWSTPGHGMSTACCTCWKPRMRPRWEPARWPARRFRSTATQPARCWASAARWQVRWTASRRGILRWS